MRRIKKWLCSVLGHQMEQVRGTVRWLDADTLTNQERTGTTGRCRRCWWMDGWTVEVANVTAIEATLEAIGYGVYLHDIRTSVLPGDHVPTPDYVFHADYTPEEWLRAASDEVFEWRREE